MDNTIRYADLWALFRKLGFDCDTVRDKRHRICEYAPTETVIILADYPPDEPVHPQTLFGVKLQLENGGVMSRDQFDLWAKRRAKVNVANGTNGTKLTKKPRASEPQT